MRGFFTKFFGNASDNIRMEQEAAVQGTVTTLQKEDFFLERSSEKRDSLGQIRVKNLDRCRMSKPFTLQSHKTARNDYYEFNATLDKARPDNTSSRSTNLYIEDLNLGAELNGLGKDAVIVDVGSSYARGTEGLKERSEFNSFSFVGVTPVVFERRGAQGYSVPVLQGTAESLPEVLRDNSIGKADVILVRNVMEEIYLGEKEFNAEGLLEDSFQGLYNALKPGGKVLIYDQYGTGERDIKFYQEYMEKAQELGFSVEELTCPPRSQFKDRICPNYLRFTKNKSIE